MEYTTTEKFAFTSSILPEDTFGVINFRGMEGLCRCYEFEINLVSLKADLDLNEILQHPVAFTIKRNGGDIPFHGILSRFEQHQSYREYVFYRAVLVPRLWWLSQTHHNQVFLDQSIPEVMSSILEDGGLSSSDYYFRLRSEYPVKEFISQYQESHLNFLLRRMEHDGMYFYFEQTESGEKVVITDTHIAHTEMSEGRVMHYGSPSGLDGGRASEVVNSWICRQKMLPKSVVLKEFNYRKPSLPTYGQADVLADRGRGQAFLYGEHFLSPEEGASLAEIRAQEFLCQEKKFTGRSLIPFIRPGYIFRLEDHYRHDFNREYLTIEARHRGSHAAYLVSGLKSALSNEEQKPHYSNEFTVIPSSIQFRPERVTPWPRCYGYMNAQIDASGSGDYAELDNEGRYKVIFPYDVSGRRDGKASGWMHMAQPYSGGGHGMHFPLHKGAEVLLGFNNGNPDRPVIIGAVPNPETPSVINKETSTKSGIKTAGGNMIHMEDKKDNQRIVIRSGSGKSALKIGRGSPWDEVFLHSDLSVKGVSGAAGEVVGWRKYLHANDSSTTITGFAKEQFLKNVVESGLKWAGEFGYKEFTINYVPELLKFYTTNHSEDQAKKEKDACDEKIEIVDFFIGKWQKALEFLRRLQQDLASRTEKGLKERKPQCDILEDQIKGLFYKCLDTGKNLNEKEKEEYQPKWKKYPDLQQQIKEIEKDGTEEKVRFALESIKNEIDSKADLQVKKSNIQVLIDEMEDHINGDLDRLEKLKKGHQEEKDGKEVEIKGYEQQRKSSEDHAEKIKKDWEHGIKIFNSVTPFLTPILTIFWEKMVDWITEPISKLSQRFKIKPDVNDSHPVKDAYNEMESGRFAYSVISQHGGTMVKQSSKSAHQDTKGMMFYTEEGPVIHYAGENAYLMAGADLKIWSDDNMMLRAEKDVALRSKGNILLQADKEINVYAEGDSLNIVSEGGLTMACDKEAEIGSSQKCNLWSDDSIKVNVGQNAVEIDGQKVLIKKGANQIQVADDKIEIKVGNSTLTIKDGQITADGKLKVTDELTAEAKIDAQADLEVSGTIKNSAFKAQGAAIGGLTSGLSKVKLKVDGMEEKEETVSLKIKEIKENITAIKAKSKSRKKQLSGLAATVTSRGATLLEIQSMLQKLSTPSAPSDGEEK